MTVVTQISDEFGVDLGLEILPGELRIVSVGHDDGQVEPDDIGIVLGQDGGHVDGASPALGELSALVHEVLVGGDVIG